jgi:small subunit ribosomal protein S4
MRKIRTKIKRPRTPWDKERIDRENLLMKTYGLKRKKEIWKAESTLRSFRRRARDLAAKKDKPQEKILLDKLQKLGLLNKDSSLDDVLGLTVESLLNRRLQTFVLKDKLANTPKQARQLITHGHIAVDGRKTIYPSFIITQNLEKKITLANESIKITKPKEIVSKETNQKENISNEGS